MNEVLVSFREGGCGILRLGGGTNKKEITASRTHKSLKNTVKPVVLNDLYVLVVAMGLLFFVAIFGDRPWYSVGCKPKVSKVTFYAGEAVNADAVRKLNVQILCR